MKNFKVAVISFLLGGLALAAAPVISELTDKYAEFKPAWFQKGLYVGLPQKGALADKNNKITGVYYYEVDFDFDAGQANDIRYGPRVPTACQYGDMCDINVDRSQFIGTDRPFCWVTDAGYIDFGIVTGVTNNNQPDAGYYISCVSHKP